MQSKKCFPLFNFYTEQDNPVVKVATAVSKKAGKAVWRNRIKRLVKESYRLNKKELVETCSEKRITLNLVFSPIGFNRLKNKNVSLSAILTETLDLLGKIKTIVQNEQSNCFFIKGVSKNYFTNVSTIMPILPLMFRIQHTGISKTWCTEGSNKINLADLKM